MTADILIIDDTPANLHVLSGALRDRGYQVRPVPDGRIALEAARRLPPDLILLDINMPGLDGFAVCRALKEDDRLRDIPVLFISAKTEVVDKVQAFAVGGVDFVTKPFQFEEVEARVATHLEIRRLRSRLEGLNASLQVRVLNQLRDLSDAHVATIVALAKLSECRDEDTGNHISRVQRYCRALARRMLERDEHNDEVDGNFVATIYHASALHDIGKVGVPDRVLLKDGPLDAEEWAVMRTHARTGADTLSAVLATYPTNAMLQMGRDIALCHHERFDGSGYPDGLVGNAIPLSARILSVADQYDALRNRRPYKPAFDEAKTYRILTEGDGRSDPRHLDPVVLDAFVRGREEMDAIYAELKD